MVFWDSFRNYFRNKNAKMTAVKTIHVWLKQYTWLYITKNDVIAVFPLFYTLYFIYFDKSCIVCSVCIVFTEKARENVYLSVLENVCQLLKFTKIIILTESQHRYIATSLHPPLSWSIYSIAPPIPPSIFTPISLSQMH